MIGVLWVIVSAVAFAAAGLAVLAWIDHRRYHEPEPALPPSVCAYCGTPLGEPWGYIRHPDGHRYNTCTAECTDLYIYRLKHREDAP